MKAKVVLLGIILISGIFASAQVGVNADNSAPDPSAGLDVKFVNKGFLPPRMTTAQRNAISTPARGLLIYNIDCNDMQYYNSAGWVPLGNTGILAAPGSITGSTSICAQSTGNVYSISSVPNATGYNWIVPSGSVITAGQGTASITVSFGSTSGSISVFACNDCYRSAMSNITITLTSLLTPGVSIAVSANPVCSANPVTFTATPVNGGSNPSYLWFKNGTSINGATSSTYTYSPPVNSDQIACMMTSNATCVTQATAMSNFITMFVSTSLPVSVNITASANPVCTGTAVTYSASAGNGGSSPAYQWKKNGTSISGATNATYSYTPVNGDVITCSLFSSYICATGNPATSNSISMIVNPYAAASVSITAAPHPSCSNPNYTFNAIPVNGGANPSYQWSINGTNVSGATNATFITQTVGNLACQMTSNYLCIIGGSSVSNTLTADMCEPICYGQPISLYCTFDGCSTPAATFSWSNSSGSWTSSAQNPVIYPAGTGYNSDVFYLVVNYAPPPGSVSKGVYFKEVKSQTTPCCGFSFPIDHVAGLVAPVSKSVYYGTVAGIPGEAGKCWITSNLGASNQATSVSDATEPSAGWYWQFNRKRGFKHDGTTLTPAWTITSISENSDWVLANDPCNIELHTPWRIPTYTEWYNVDNAGGWTNWNGPWNSALKLHAAGYLTEANGSLTLRGSTGVYYSSTQYSSNQGNFLRFGNTYSVVGSDDLKAKGFTLRCLKTY